MIQIALISAIAIWFSLSARKLDQNAFFWAAIGVGSYYMVSWIGIRVIRLFFSDSISSKSEMMTYLTLSYAVVAVALACVFFVHRELVSRARSVRDANEPE